MPAVQSTARRRKPVPAVPEPIANHPRVQEATAVLAKWLDAQRAYLRIPGVSAAVVFDQDVVWSGGFGWADIARRAPADAFRSRR